MNQHQNPNGPQQQQQRRQGPPQQQQQPDDRIYVGSGKVVDTQYGKLMKLSFNRTDLETMLNNLNEKDWITLNVNKRREPSQYGATHYMTVDTWRPKGDDYAAGQSNDEYNHPQQQRQPQRQQYPQQQGSYSNPPQQQRQQGPPQQQQQQRQRQPRQGYYQGPPQQNNLPGYESQGNPGYDQNGNPLPPPMPDDGGFNPDGEDEIPF